MANTDDTYLAELRARLARISLDWIQYEQGGVAGSDPLLKQLHTIKGESGLLGYSAVAEIVHALETAIAHSEPSPVLGDMILSGVDLIDGLLDQPPGEGSEEAQAFLGNLQVALLSASEPTTSAAVPSPPGDDTKTAKRPARPLATATPTTGTAKTDALTPNASTGSTTGQALSRSAVDIGTVRVTAEQLDRMRDIIGELLLTRVRLSHSARSLQTVRTDVSHDVLELGRRVGDTLGGLESQLREDVFRMGNLVTGLEDLTRELRMVPVGTLFNRYPRAVRDLGRQLERPARLVIGGEGVEVDRHVLEALDEPLLHLVRNAVDHGLEDQSVRSRAGKPATGTVSLEASVIGETLHVRMSDDGRGIDPEEVRQRAVAMNVAGQSEADALTDPEAMDLLFLPRMTTRTEVTQLSGRGVGLSVVREALNALGGHVSIERSDIGKGTTFHLSVPISVAITPVVLCRVGQGRYAVPAHQILAITDDSEIEMVRSIDGPAIRFEGQLIPLVSLHTTLNEAIDHNLRGERFERLIIASTGQDFLALTDTSEHILRDAVLKSAGVLHSGGVISAGVALEDGDVALVLDLPRLLADWMRRAGRGQAIVAKTPPTARDCCVLVVEDSPIVRDLVAGALRSHSVQVIEAADGQDALDVLAKGTHVDLIVTDIEMPRVDGLELLRRVRRDEGERRIPTIVVSTRGSDEDKLRAVEAGADAYLVKSDFSRDGLWALVERFLG